MTAPRIHVHAAAPANFFVNSFLIEGARSVILVDAQFVLSEARKVADMIAALAKPLAGIIITHPHPDHYNGLATILERYPRTRVYATEGTIAGMRATAEPKRAYWTPIIGADYPQHFAFPDVTIADGDRLTIDGIELIVDDCGANECSDLAMLALPQSDAVIVSDLVYHRAHPWLAEGRSALWLAALSKARHRYGAAQTIYAGHGGAGSAAIIDEQAAYIADVRERVAAALTGDGILTDSAKAAVRDAVLARYGGWPLEMIIDMNSASLAAEIAAQA
jgi:glyoxylase-like metal-dependent hydrolase (beta-lactamase superfamily II)